jgi:NAD-dependent DNA ligase
LHLAARSAGTPFLLELLKRGVKPKLDDYGNTPLHYAMTTHARDKELWDQLIEAGNPVDGGEPPLIHSARVYWNHVAVQYLLEKGADPNARDEDGKTVMEAAQALGQDKIVAVLERWEKQGAGAAPDRCPECGAEGLGLEKQGGSVPSDQVFCNACGGMFDTESMEQVPTSVLRTESMSFLFTGKLSSMSRQEAKRRVEELGGVSRSSVSKDLDYLVVGDEGSPLYGNGKKGSKMVAAEKLIDQGADLKIISESVFMKLKRN